MKHFWRVGLGITAGTNPVDRKFATLMVDGLVYVTDNGYFGAGINYPLWIFARGRGNIGGQAFFVVVMKSDRG